MKVSNSEEFTDPLDIKAPEKFCTKTEEKSDKNIGATLVM